MRNDNTAAPRVIVDVVRIEDVDAAAEVVENIARIAALPLDVLPAGPARDALFALAEAGHDINVYQPVGCEHRRWTIWVRPAHPSIDGRYTP
ncbi:MAG: hypothetical protein ACXWP0_18565, partial [Ktedonobacterales bacterium]